ncbi:hypothetical protein BC833DRAFT_237569 [Globomyces pollinis-pini]|nr:hypothetical protein BC833DRAFT_237569 [Globomyces pollinis-pini]
MLFNIIQCLILLISVSSRVSFEDHQVWEVYIQKQEEANTLHQLEHLALIDIWNTVHQGMVQFSVSKTKQSKVDRMLKRSHLKYHVKIDNLQDSIDQQIYANNMIDTKPFDNTIPKSSDPDHYLSKYHTIEEIYDYMDSLILAYPHLIEPFEIGQSYEKRPIRGIKIHVKNSTVIHPKEYLFHGSIHAREWIGPAMLQYLATTFLIEYGKDDVITQLLNDNSFDIIPVFNVDGYAFSHNENRMWRKNRVPTNFFCIGTDINRNWDYSWGRPGASSNPCSDAYYGAKPFSAPETTAISNYILSRSPHLIAYIDFHAYGLLWMYPFGDDCNKHAKTESDLHRVGNVASKAVKNVHGTAFKVGSICRIIYQASGNSVDWAYTKGGVPFTYGIELRDTGSYGFLLPPKFIVPSGEEMVAGVIAMSQEITKISMQNK